MRRLDMFASCQVNNCPRLLHASRAMIGSCRQIELTHRRTHQTLNFILQLAKLPDLPDAHVGITKDWMPRIDIRESRALKVACGSHPFANRFAGFTQVISDQFLIIYAWHFDVNIDAIQHGTRDLFSVFSHCCKRHMYKLLRIAIKTAQTGIHTIESTLCLIDRGKLKLRGYFLNQNWNY
jgi:hypothetical protein